MSKVRQVPIDQIEPGPIRHARLTPKLVAYARGAYVVLQEVYPIPLDEFLAGFLRDDSPAREIAIWHVMAGRYLAVLREYPEADLSVKRDVFLILLLSSTGMDTKAIVAAEGLESLSSAEAQDVAERFGMHRAQPLMDQRMPPGSGCRKA